MDARSQKIDEIMYETNEKISAIVKLDIRFSKMDKSDKQTASLNKLHIVISQI